MELATPAREAAPSPMTPPRRTRRRTPGWAVLGVLVALAVTGPLLALPASFLRGGAGVDQIALTLLPPALTKSVVLGLGVAVGTLVIGGGLAITSPSTTFPAGAGWTGP